MHPMLNIGIRAAREAGRVITRNVDRVDSLKIDRKGRNDFVSDVDRQAETAIVRVLQRAYPDHAILGEESGAGGGDRSDYRWIVDPLDGTTNFLHGLPHFSVSIGLEHRGRLDQGIIYDPMRQELFTASRGAGAWLDNKRLRMGRGPHFEDALLGTGFPYRTGQALDAYSDSLRQFTEASGGIRRMGSAALDLAYVAAGRLDGVWLTGLSPWDLAAGALIVQEAGGIVTDFRGSDDYMKTGYLVAGTARVHEAMLGILKPLRGHFVQGDAR